MVLLENWRNYIYQNTLPFSAKMWHMVATHSIITGQSNCHWQSPMDCGKVIRSFLVTPKLLFRTTYTKVYSSLNYDNVINLIISLSVRYGQSPSCHMAKLQCKQDARESRRRFLDGLVIYVLWLIVKHKPSLQWNFIPPGLFRMFLYFIKGNGSNRKCKAALRT